MSHQSWQPYRALAIATPALVSTAELTAPVRLVVGPPYRAARILVRVAGRPIGYADVDIADTQILERDHIVAALDAPARARLLRALEAAGCDLDRMDSSCRSENTSAMGGARRAEPITAAALVTVAVCTRDRANSLATTLASLVRQTYTALEILVVDNAPHDRQTAELLQAKFPTARYVIEPQAGLDNARNRAVYESNGEIVAFIDDDATADPGWVAALVKAFDEPQVMCVTGLVAPVELETRGQELFERRGYSKSFDTITVTRASKLAQPFPIFVSFLGTGCNSAYRRSVFDQVGLFDPRLDMGTPVPGGGDHDMFARIIMAGHALKYTPDAIVFHRHIADLALMMSKIGEYDTAFTAYLTKFLVNHPGAAIPVGFSMARSTIRRTIRGLAAVVLRRDRSLGMALSPLLRCYRGPAALYRSHRHMRRRQRWAKAEDGQPHHSGRFEGSGAHALLGGETSMPGDW